MTLGLSFALALIAVAGAPLRAQAPARPPAQPAPQTSAQPAASQPASHPASQPAAPPPAGSQGQSGAASGAAPSGVQAPTDTAVPAPQIIGWIRAGQTRNGRLENGDFRMGDGTWADVWYVEGSSGQRVVIDVRPQAFDGYLQLLDPFGTKLAENSAATGAHAAQVTFSLPAAGRYQIVVNNVGADLKTGPYTLVVR